MTTTQTDAKAIFLDALDCTGADELIRFLDEACGSDAGLRAQVETLIRAHRDAGAFLGGVGRIDENSAFPPNTRIGPYLLREQIGEGGMGLVFVADQETPVKRRVALKVVKPWMDTRQVLARFEAERQALAMMDHPNIAKVFDGGTTTCEPGGVSPGRPYFVMELVRGVPITEYCDAARLTPRQRLELFLPVCRAIQHAHQKGVTHRDIKPSNLLVTLYDSHPVPKVIDFGIAKAVGSAFADHSVYTGFAQLVGTPTYMSPEQAEMSAQDVDTRADVYALGVVLYELLTGTTPFDGETLRQAGFDEMRRIIREDEPAKPSQRVTTMAVQEQSTVSARRGSDGRQLGRQLRGGLDWVVMTCLAKDRTRRYESAGALAADIERYLRDEAVTACPPSTGYRIRTFVRRNRTALLAGGLVAAAMVAGTAVSIWQAVKARGAQHNAESAEGRAVMEAAIATEVKNFLRDDLLSHVDLKFQFENEIPLNPNITVRDTLDRAAAKIGDRFHDQPLVEAEIRFMIGTGYRSVREPALVINQLEKAVELRKAHLGSSHRDTLTSVLCLAGAYENAGRLDMALGLHAEWMELFIKGFGTDGPDAPTYLHPHATRSHHAGNIDDAERSMRACLDIQRRHGLNTAASLIWMSRIHWRQKKYVTAEAEAREAITFMEHNKTYDWVRFVTMSLLGGALAGQGQYSESKPLLLKGYEGIAEWDAILGPLPWNWRKVEAIERIVWFYEKTNQPEKARAWREMLPPK